MMFNLLDKYKVDKKIPMKDFIPKDLKPEVKKKIRDSVKNVVLAYQIVGEEIPSLINNDRNYQVIQFYNFQLQDIKKAVFVASLYQEIIKSPCVIRMYDHSSEIYSFALKRLNQNDKTQIVVTDKLLTNIFPLVLPSTEKLNFFNELSAENIKNQTNKVTFYFEIYVRAYILTNDKVYANASTFLVKPIWYSENKVLEVYNLLLDLARTKEKAHKATANSEKMQLNQEIRKLIKILDEI